MTTGVQLRSCYYLQYIQTPMLDSFSSSFSQSFKFVKIVLEGPTSSRDDAAIIQHEGFRYARWSIQVSAFPMNASHSLSSMRFALCLSAQRSTLCLVFSLNGLHFVLRAGMRSRCGHFRWTVRTFDLISDQRCTLSVWNSHFRSGFRRTVHTLGEARQGSLRPSGFQSER